jgi:rhodanese-related sulfurtransferase
VVSDAKSVQASKGGPDDKEPQAASVVKTIDEATLRAIRGSSAAVVLDTRSRAAYLRRHREGAINIPLSELATRAGAEMPRSGLIVIDCFAEQQHGPCGVAIKLLTLQGFSELAVLNRRSE